MDENKSQLEYPEKELDAHKQLEPGIVYTEQEVDASKENPYGATVLKYKYETKRSQAEVTNIASE